MLLRVKSCHRDSSFFQSVTRLTRRDEEAAWKYSPIRHTGRALFRAKKGQLFLP